MSDYSFLKTGLSNLVEPVKISEKEREDIEIMLGLFTSNALINASKYVHYCGRNAVTKTDITYGLQYEVFEFLQRNDISEGLDEIRQDYERLKLEEYEVDDDDEDGEYEENVETEDGDYDNIQEDEFNLGKTELGELIMPDEEIQEFSRISDENINDENREFVEKIHNYHDTWSSWTPQTELEIILKNAIDKIN